MAAKRWCVLCAILLALLSFLLVLTVAVIDPFEIYHRALFYSPPYASGTQVYSNAGVAKSFHYDSVIVGSSVTENCTPSVYDAALGGRFVKLCMNGGLSGDHAKMLDAAFSQRDIVRVVYGLDLFAYSQYYNNLKAPFPEYLYDDNLLNDVSYWFNKGVLFTQIPEALSRIGTPDEDEDRDRMYYWSPPDLPGHDALWAGVDLVSPLPDQAIDERMLEFAQGCAENNLLAYVRAHRETTFDVFFPPYSLLYWAKQARSGQFETCMAQKRLLLSLLVGEENVRVHDFQLAPWVSEDDLYYDPIHYTSPVNDGMAAAIAEGTYLVSDASQIDGRIEALRDAVYALFIPSEERIPE